jgi:hypothetical protein
MRSRPLLARLFFFFLVAATLAGAQDHLFTVSSTDGMLRRVNPMTGTTYWSVQMVTNNAVNAQGCTGLALQPGTGTLFAIMREVSQPTVRKLASINPNTGAATILGALGANFAGIAFRSDGVLYGVTGDGSTTLPPESLFTLNTTNGQPTFVMALGNGADGESITFGADGYLYHLSGCCIFNVDTVLERIDTTTLTVTSVPLSGFSYHEILSSTLWVGGTLLCADLYDHLLAVNTNGVSTQIGTFDHSAVKGVAFVPTPPTQAFFRPYGTGCAAASGLIPLLTGFPAPSVGATVQVTLILAPASAAGVLAIGSGTFSLPIPSAACQVQILPIAPDLLNLQTSASGSWTASFTVPAGLPTDLFTQTAIVDGAGFVVSNPLQVHIQ